MDDSYNRAKGAEEHILDLGLGRQVAYAHNGPTASRTVVIFFSGLFSVGSAPDVPQPCRALGVHWIHPTLPGLGRSSARAAGEEYHVALARDMTALLDHLYPTGDFDRLYVGGGSYGTVPAQILYGAAYHVFPAGRKLAGCLLQAGFSPFRYHVGHAQTLSWHTWFSVGPPSQLVPFQLLQRTLSTLLALKFRTIDGVKAFLEQTLYSRMGADEQARMAEFLAGRGRTRDEFVDAAARGVVRCCEQWAGFHEVSDVIHSDWGFDPAALDDDHARCPVLVVGSDGDPQGGSTNAWLGASYTSARVRTVPGGHMSTLFYTDELWREVFEMSGEMGPAY
ncbi:hypothetical protein ACO1O0_009167 [Amphichorda felina]